MSLRSRTAFRASQWLISAASFSIVRAAARVFSRLVPGNKDIKVRLPGYSVYVRTPDRLLAALLYKYSLGSSLETEIYRTRIKPGMTVVDIGANVGLFTLLFSGLAGKNGRVLAFEPDPLNSRLLEKSVKENNGDNIICRQAAISDRNGPMELFLSEENRGDHRIYRCREERACVKVEAMTLDTALGPGPRADFIKMDIQGAEYKALTGMEETLKNSPGLTMLCEFCPALLRAAGDNPEALLDKLTTHGFSLKYLDEDSHSARATSARELISLCNGDRYVNLLLEKNPH